MNESLALQVIRELQAAEEIYRETMKAYYPDCKALQSHSNLKSAGDKARAFLIEFDDK